MKTDKITEQGWRIGIIVCILALLAACVVWEHMMVVVRAEESSQEKHLVIKVIEDEELIDIEDYDVPLASFTDGQNAGTRHVVLMAVMLSCMICYVLYEGRNERKLIDLRKQAAKAQRQMMMVNRRT